MFIYSLIITGILFLYYAVFCALIPIGVKALLHMPDEFVRKYQHIAFAMSIFIIVELHESWVYALLSSISLIVIAYPFLWFIEKTKDYHHYLVDRKKKGGELRSSLLLIQLCFSLLILIFWGILGTQNKEIIVVGVMAWGFGDAAAALFGKAFGKTKIHVWLVDKKKTFFGSNAMTITAIITLFLMLYFYVELSWLNSLILGIIIAPFTSALELFSKRGLDTLVVPVGTSALLFGFFRLFEFMGWIT